MSESIDNACCHIFQALHSRLIQPTSRECDQCSAHQAQPFDNQNGGQGEGRYQRNRPERQAESDW